MEVLERIYGGISEGIQGKFLNQSKNKFSKEVYEGKSPEIFRYPETPEGNLC